MIETKFTETLNAYSDGAKVRFHMPGHAGIPFGSSLDCILKYDVTELPYTDDLHSPLPESGIEQLYRDCRRIYPRSADVVLSCSGSTALIKAAVISIMRSRGADDTFTVACDRAVHYSVIGALAYCKVNIVWFDGSPSTLAGIVKNNEISLIITTSPDYYGRLRDIAGLADIAKHTGASFVVDAAHGAHLDFWRGGELSATSYLGKGVTAVIQSLHKTLPALTGASILHTDDTFARGEYSAAIRRCESSSPSFVILRSIAECLKYMENYGKEKLETVARLVSGANDKLSSLGWICDAGDMRDPFRMCIAPPDFNTARAYSHLYDNGVVCEFFDSERIVLIPSINHTESDFDTLTDACKSYILADSIVQNITEKSYAAQKYPQVKMSIYEAYRKRAAKQPLSSLEGKICAEPLYSYPPGLPLIVPGEVFDDEVIEALRAIGINEAEAVVE